MQVKRTSRMLFNFALAAMLSSCAYTISDFTQRSAHGCRFYTVSIRDPAAYQVRW